MTTVYGVVSMPIKNVVLTVIAISIFLPRTVIATKLEFNDASTLSADANCVKLQNEGWRYLRLQPLKIDAVESR